MKQWNRVSEGLLPPKGRCVLLNVDESKKEGLPACVVVGYRKNSSDGSFYFVTPGANIRFGREVRYWSDCLGDDFQCPLWPNKTMNRKRLDERVTDLEDKIEKEK